MASNGQSRRSPKPRGPRPPKPPVTSTRPPTEIELWYLECLRLLSGYLRRAPTIQELALYCDRTVTPTWHAMISLEGKGRVKRNADRRFEIVLPDAGAAS